MTEKQTLKLSGSDLGVSSASGSGLVATESASVPDSVGGLNETRGRPRLDHLEDIWVREVVPLLEENPDLRAVAIFEELMRSHPELGEGVRRTIYRRVREWRMKHGGEREVVFRQVHEPGVLGMSDFTDMGGMGVTVSGRPLKHRLYHFRLVCSGFEHASVVLNGESFAALSKGLQDALFSVGGVPREHRTDSLSAAFRNLGKQACEDLTRRYEDLCKQYGMKPTRNNRGVAHENGSIESAHGHLKRAIRDALMLRGSSDFASVEDYRVFVDGIVSGRNARRSKRIEVELKHLGPLPAHRSADYDEATVRVTSSGGFTLRKVFYSVPSRLIGHLLRVRLYDDHLDVFDGCRKLLTLPRGRAGKGGRRTHVVNYHHSIHSLRRKPMALKGLAYRDQLFPREAYRLTYELALKRLSDRAACRMAVDLLALAHDLCCEAELAEELEWLLAEGRLPDMDELRTRLRPDAGTPPDVEVELPSLSEYDDLFAGSDAALEGTEAEDEQD